MSEADWLTSGTIEVAGKRVFYREAGEGPPLVLLHGAGSGDGRDWTFSVFRELARTHRVIAPDRPGIGGSDAIAGMDDPRAQARHLRAAMAEICVENPLLVGHSYGGTGTLAWALEAPDLPGMVLAAAVGFPLQAPGLFKVLAGPAGAAFAPLLAGPMHKSAMKAAIKGAFAPQPAPPAYVTYGLDHVWRKSSEIRNNAREIAHVSPALADMQARYGTLTMPVEVLAGDQDANVPADSQARRLAEALPDARLTMLPGHGHMIHVTAPDALLDAVGRLGRA